MAEERFPDPQGADPFLWTTLIAVLPGGVAAAFAPGHAPGYALHNTAVYKLEVGLVFFAAAYALGLIVHLAYQGRSLGQLNLGVVATDLPDPNPDADPDLTEARSALAEFANTAKRRLDTLDDNFSSLVTRLEAVEAYVEATEQRRLRRFRRRSPRVLSRQ